MKISRLDFLLAFLSVVLIFWTCAREFYLPDDMNYISEIFSMRDNTTSVARNSSVFYLLVEFFAQLFFLNQFESYRVLLVVNLFLFLSVLYRLLYIAKFSGWLNGSIFSAIISTLYLSPYLLIQIRSSISASLAVHCFISLLFAPPSSILNLFFPFVLLLSSGLLHLSSLPFVLTTLFFIIFRYFFNVPSLNFKKFMSFLWNIHKYSFYFTPLFFSLGYLFSVSLLSDNFSIAYQLSTFSDVDQQVFSWPSFLILLLCACLVEPLFVNTKVFVSSTINFILPSLLIFSISFIGGSSYYFPLQQRFLVPYSLLLIPLVISRIFDKPRSPTTVFLIYIITILTVVTSSRRLLLLL